MSPILVKVFCRLFNIVFCRIEPRKTFGKAELFLPKQGHRGSLLDDLFRAPADFFLCMPMPSSGTPLAVKVVAK